MQSSRCVIEYRYWLDLTLHRVKQLVVSSLICSSQRLAWMNRLGTFATLDRSQDRDTGNASLPYSVPILASASCHLAPSFPASTL